MLKIKILLSTYLLFVVVVLNAQPAQFQAKVIGVKDGDTFDVLYNFTKYTVRLAHIDCPEKSQPFGNKAKQYAAALCFGKMVAVRGNGKKDRNKRIIAEVWVQNTCVNKALVQAGMAWHFIKYSNSVQYAGLQAQAKQNKIGLWADANAIAPWDWRKLKRNKKLLF